MLFIEIINVEEDFKVRLNVERTVFILSLISNCVLLISDFQIFALPFLYIFTFNKKKKNFIVKKETNKNNFVGHFVYLCSY
jgi:hypothetical protein